MSENGSSDSGNTRREILLRERRSQTARPIFETEGIQAYSSMPAYRDILIKHRWLVFAVALAVTASVAVYSALTKPEYRATARILVGEDNPEIRTLKDLFPSAAPNDDNFLATQVNVLQSENLAWQTIEHLQLTQSPEFAKYLQPRKSHSIPPPAKIKTELLGAFKDRLLVDRKRDTRMIEVSFDSTDPELSARVANDLVKSYGEYNFRIKSDAARQTRGWMEQQLEELKNKVENSQEALVDYERKNSIVSMVGDKESVVEQELADLSRDLTQAQSNRIEKESLFQLATSTSLAGSGPVAHAQPASAASEEIEKVQLYHNGGQTEIDVIGTGHLRFHVLQLDHPDRLVLDFAGAALKTSGKNIPGNSDPVRAIRLSQFSPEVARVVIDLREIAPYRVSTSDKKVKVEFGSVKTDKVTGSIAGKAQDSKLVTTTEATAEKNEITPAAGSASDVPANPAEPTTAPQVRIVSQSNLLQKLEARNAELREQYADALAQYGETFPKVLRIRAEMDEVQTQIERERRGILERLHNDFQDSKNREALLTTAVAQQKAKVGKVNQLLIKRTLLQREFEINQKLYEDLLQRLKDSTATAGLRATNITIVDEAQSPPIPFRPKKFRNSAIGLLAGLIFGFLLAMVRETLDNTIKSAEEVEMLVAAPALAMIPSQNGLLPHARAYRYLRSVLETRTAEGKNKLFPFKRRPMLKEQNERVELSVLHNPGSPVSEAFRALRTSILLPPAGHAPQVILVTSAQPTEGKTCVSLNLAFTLAQKGGRVLLLDADFRQPGIAVQLGLNNKVGLSNTLASTHSVESSLSALSTLKNLSVLPSGPCPRNPAELLSSPAMGDLMGTLRQQFDHVIIDSPPVLAVTDATILSSMVDGVLIVVQNDKTDRAACLRACRTLMNSGARILGTVLNKVDARRGGYYTYYHRKENRDGYTYYPLGAHSNT